MLFPFPFPHGGRTRGRCRRSRPGPAPSPARPGRASPPGPAPSAPRGARAAAVLGLSPRTAPLGQGPGFIAPARRGCGRWRSSLGPGVFKGQGKGAEKALLEAGGCARRSRGAKASSGAPGRAAPIVRPLLPPQAAVAAVGSWQSAPWLCPGLGRVRLPGFG